MSKIPIVVVTYNRPESLKRLLSSLAKAQYRIKVELIISIDGGGGDEVIRIANEFEWTHGKKSIIVHEFNLGLRDHIISCGDLVLENDGVVILEDDLYVSSSFYYFVEQSLKFYKDDEKIGGFSLYAHQFNEVAQFPFLQISEDSDVFFLQYASSWGQFYTKSQWADFKQWYLKNKDGELTEDNGLPPNLIAWPDTSWKKYVVQFFLSKNKFSVYPRVSLTTNFGDSGIHMKVKEKFLQIPLVYKKNKFKFIGIDESNAVYDVYCELLPNRLKNLAPFLKDYDFAVDLYGMKTLIQLSEEYILTSKKCDNAIITFGKEMKPLEANIIENIAGNDLFLAKQDNCYDDKFFVKLHKCYLKEELNYHYSLRKWHYINKDFGIEKLSVEKTDQLARRKKISIENISNALKRFTVRKFKN